MSLNTETSELPSSPDRTCRCRSRNSAARWRSGRSGVHLHRMDRDVRRLGVIAQLLLPRVDLPGVTIPGNLCLCPFSRHAIEGQLVRRKPEISRAKPPQPRYRPGSWSTSSKPAGRKLLSNQSGLTNLGEDRPDRESGPPWPPRPSCRTLAASRGQAHIR